MVSGINANETIGKGRFKANVTDVVKVKILPQQWNLEWKLLFRFSKYLNQIRLSCYLDKTCILNYLLSEYWRIHHEVRRMMRLLVQ